MQTTTLKRVFLYNGNPLVDPDVSMSPAAVKDTYSAMYPELLNAEINGPVVKETVLEFTFHRTTGTKGRKPLTKAITATKPVEKLLSFLRRLDIAASEAQVPTAAILPGKLTKLRTGLTPLFGGQSLHLPAANCPLLL
jgi:PRTRC genetic system protein C